MAAGVLEQWLKSDEMKEIEEGIIRTQKNKFKEIFQEFVANRTLLAEDADSTN